MVDLAVVDALAIEFDGAPFTGGDVIAAAMLEDLWPTFSARADRHAGRVAPVDEVAVERAVEQFRRERRLGAASEFRAWLARRRLDGEALRRWLAWSLNEAESSAGDDGDRGIPSDQLPEDVWWPEAVLAGDFERWVDVLVSWLAVADTDARAPEGDPGLDAERVTSIWKTCGPAGTEAPRTARLQHLAELRWQFRAWAQGPVPAAGVSECLASRRLDWTLFEFDEWRFGSKSAASEAALCVVSDHEDPDMVAQRAGASRAQCRYRFEALDLDSARVLVALQPGELAVEGRGLVRLITRTPPEIDDVASCERALGQVISELVATRAAGRLRRVGAW